MLPTRKLIAPLIIGLILRILPMLIWIRWRCVRDECTYLRISERLAQGEGMTESAGWLWAPGYPVLLSLHEVLLGEPSFIKGSQVLISAFIILLMFHLGQRLGGMRTGLIAAWLYALSPTQIFFSQSLWSECLYGGLLLLALLFFHKSADEATDSPLRLAAITGALVGCCVLFRGVATYMLPIFIVALLWSRFRAVEAWKQSLALVFAAVIVVAPYSLYATKKFDTFIISDRTLGQMMWLGNNTFDPITFDFGNGQLSNRAFKRHTEDGRKPCALRTEALKRDKCLTQEGIDWIKENPKEFIFRMPMRVAQMLNPHSFLTRHLRFGYWRGMPQWMDEVIVIWSLLWSLAVLWGGAAALMLRGRGRTALLIGGILTYHVAAISALAGLTRYRVPLEPLLMLFLAQGIAAPNDLLTNVEPWRKWLMTLVLGAVIPLTIWYLPTGWAWWRTW